MTFRLSAFLQSANFVSFLSAFLNSPLKLPMFTLIGSLILIFKELRFIRSEGLRVYLNFPALSRAILIFLFAGSIRKHNPLINSKNPGFLWKPGFS